MARATLEVARRDRAVVIANFDDSTDIVGNLELRPTGAIRVEMDYTDASGNPRRDRGGFANRGRRVATISLASGVKILRSRRRGNPPSAIPGNIVTRWVK